MVYGLCFKIYGLYCMVSDLWYMDYGLWCMAYSLRFLVYGVSTHIFKDHKLSMGNIGIIAQDSFRRLLPILA